MSEGDNKPSRSRAREGDVFFQTHILEHVDAAVSAYMKENGLNKRQATLTAFKALGLPVPPDDLCRASGRLQC